jgi:RNA polymerase sigma-70 factor (ECF subfamily)
VPLEQPDQAVLLAAKRGDADAFAWIFETYQVPVRSYVSRMLGDRPLAEDLTQEIFIRVHQSLKSFNGRSLFTSWLFQIAKNRLIDEFRSRDRQAGREVEYDDLLTTPAVEPTGDTRETVSAIWAAVAALEVNLKTPLLLRDVAGLSYLEIAEVLEINNGLVKWRIYKAREAIQIALAEAGLSPTFPTRAETRPNRRAAAPAAA